MEEQGLEAALEQTEKDAERAIKTVSALAAEVKRVQRFAQTGSIRDLAKALDLSQQLAGAVREAIATAREGWRFETEDYMESGGYSKEVLLTARDRGLAAEEQDGRILSYPSLLRLLPADVAVEIDRKRSREIRPTRVVERLRAAQTRPPKFRPEPFLEALVRAYKWLGAGKRGWEIGEPLRLADVYRVLTVLPGQSTTYSIPEFTRDIYLLDESRVDRTKDDLRLTLPASSGGRESGALRTVTKEGNVKTYYSIAFRP